MNWIIKLLQGSPEKPASTEKPAVPAVPRTRIVDPADPVYPPVDSGFSLVPIDRLLEQQGDVLQRLRQISGMGDEDFDRFYMVPIRAYASYIHLLPVTRNSHYRGAGGMLRYGIEAAFFSLQSAEGKIFSSSEGIEKRRITEPAWRYAAFLAGLCSELSRPLTDFIVVAENGKEWPAYDKGLVEWATEHQVTRYMVRWLDGSVSSRRGNPAFIIPKIIPGSSMQYLQNADPRIPTDMMAVINNTVSPGDEFTLYALIRTVKTKRIDLDIAKSPDLYGNLTVGVHLEPYLLDGMRKLIKNGKWRINEDKPRLWYGTDGLFLVWGPSAKDELLSELKGVAGIPSDETTLMEMMVASRVLLRSGDGPFWEILNPVSQKPFKAVKIANPLSILPEEPVISPLPSALSRSPLSIASSAATIPAVTKPSPVAKNTASTTALVPDEDGVINVPSDEEESGSSQAPDTAEANDSFMDALPTTVAETLRAIAEDIQNGNPPKGIHAADEGFAIEQDAISHYGQQPADFAKALQIAKWLVIDPEYPERPSIQATVNGKKVRAFVIKPRMAKKLKLQGKPE